MPSPVNSIMSSLGFGGGVTGGQPAGVPAGPTGMAYVGPGGNFASFLRSYGFTREGLDPDTYNKLMQMYLQYKSQAMDRWNAKHEFMPTDVGARSSGGRG